MSKPPNMIDLLSVGLRGASARQGVIAGNIANAQTPGYQRKAIEFEKALSRALESSDFGDRPVETRLVTPAGETADETGNNVDLEVEIGDLVANSAKYKAYLRILNKAYKQMELAMTVE